MAIRARRRTVKSGKPRVSGKVGLPPLDQLRGEDVDVGIDPARPARDGARRAPAPDAEPPRARRPAATASRQPSRAPAVRRIVSTSSSYEMPAARACAGRSDSSVMPGSVFTSTNQGTPARSTIMSTRE